MALMRFATGAVTSSTTASLRELTGGTTRLIRTNYTVFARGCRVKGVEVEVRHAKLRAKVQLKKNNYNNIIIINIFITTTNYYYYNYYNDGLLVHCVAYIQY